MGRRGSVDSTSSSSSSAGSEDSSKQDEIDGLVGSSSAEGEEEDEAEAMSRRSGAHKTTWRSLAGLLGAFNRNGTPPMFRLSRSATRDLHQRGCHTCP
mmetsp:Transcript_87254/g.229881  ORF Transcript_87254/g.229881 Transcript_87254/m.229881 type:complete len:98 (-) Transcript_87254:112-405(-)